MPSIQEIKKELGAKWAVEIGFEPGTDRRRIVIMDKTRHLYAEETWSDSEDSMNIEMCRDRIINPMIAALEARLATVNQN